MIDISKAFCEIQCQNGCAATGRCFKEPEPEPVRKQHPAIGWADAARLRGEMRKAKYDGTFELYGRRVR